jgi:hypothetical protein
MSEIESYICLHVFEFERPILLVAKEDGDWQFLCGDEHDWTDLPKVVGLNHLLDRDSTLLELLDLPDNWEAERVNVNSPWQRREIKS